MKKTSQNCGSGPNPLHPDRMTAHERRTEIYGLLATALVRLLERDRDLLSQNTGDCSLHFSREQSGIAAPIHRRTA